MDFGAFCELEPGLTTLLHSSELSWTKKNSSAKKMFKIGDEISCVITEIDKEKRRVSISHRLTEENPYTLLEKKHPVGSIVEGSINNMNEYAIYIKIDDFEVDGFLHANDLTYNKNPEEELKQYSKNQRLKVKILEIKPEQQKVRVGLKQTETDPFEWFKDKKINDTVTVKIVDTDTKGLLVQPEGSKIQINIKKSQIAINIADARPNRFIKGDRIDAAISELDLKKRKILLSIKLLEELQNKEAVSKFSSPLSGKNLPFSSLSDKLEKKVKKKKE
jgi:small subunit ribosomal protein S1